MTENLTEFRTTTTAFIRAGSLYCNAQAEAVYDGKSSNIAAGEVNIMQCIPAGVSSVINPLPFSGGRDEESDDELRERILSSYKNIPNGGNTAYYKMLAQNVSGVAEVKVLPRKRGRGTVDIIVTSDSGAPSQELIDRVSATMEARREICVDIDVSAPTTKSVDVTVAVTAAAGYTSATVLQKTNDAITSYFNGKLLGKIILLAELGSTLYSVRGVKNYSITSPTADVAINETELPVLGNLNIIGAIL